MTGISEFALSALVLVVAFLIGFAIRRGSICLVAATEAWIISGKTARIRAFVIAASASGMLILPIAWLFPVERALVSTHSPSAMLFAAAACFGMGALINGGCAFGTLARFSGGQLAYGGTIAASSVGALIAAPLVPLPTLAPPTFAEPVPMGVSALALFAVLARPAIAARHWRSLRSALGRRGSPLRPLTAMLVIGSLGGLLYALAGSWTHLGIIGQEARLFAGLSMDAPTLKSLAGGIALVSGAWFAAWHSRSFRWRPGHPMLWLRCIVGGFLMGGSAAFIPGGNGALVVHGVPSGALHAWIAIAVIVATLALAFLAMRTIKGSR